MIPKQAIINEFNELLLKADESTKREINEAIKRLNLSEAVDIKIICSSDDVNCYFLTLNSYNDAIDYDLA